MLIVPVGRMAFTSDADAAAAKRREIAERLRRGEDVSITASGRVVEPNDPEAQEIGRAHV